MKKTRRLPRLGALLASSVGLFALTSATVTAHTGDGGWGHHMWGDGMWGGGWMWMLLIPIMFILLPLGVIYLVVSKDSEESEDNAMTILREQYARGEIDEDEFDKRKRKLTGK